jgi:hypothetical protein
VHDLDWDSESDSDLAVRDSDLDSDSMVGDFTKSLLVSMSLNFVSVSL